MLRETLTLFPQFLTDGLTLTLAAICGVPALWGFYSLFFFGTARERVVGYASALAALAWLEAVADLFARFG